MLRFPALFALGATVWLTTLATPPELKCASGEEPYVNDLLYFGTAKPNGVVTPEDWSEFLRTSVTPRFPQGLTMWSASGQWQGSNGAIVQEDTFVLNLVHPNDLLHDRAVRAISTDYKQRFEQESVLRIKNPVCASF